MTVPTSLYRLRSPNGLLLYIGISGDFTRRLTQHTDRPWFNIVGRIDVEHFRTREDALRAEMAAIRAEHPIFNRAGLESNPDGWISLVERVPEFGDDCERCAQHGRHDLTCFPVAAKPDDSQVGLTGSYVCDRCRFGWTCWWSVNAAVPA